MPKTVRSTLTTASFAIGVRLRKMRKDRNWSQDEIEKRTGLQRSYISRVENHHTVPSIETLEKLAAALEIPLHRFFYEGEEPPPLPRLSNRTSLKELPRRGEAPKDLRFFGKLRRMVAGMSEKDRRLFFSVAAKVVSP